MIAMNPTVLAYAAGIVDGEGCITLVQDSRRLACEERISVANTDPRLLQWLVSYFSGRISADTKRSPKHSQGWKWQLTGQSCIPFLEAIRPYLILKAEQADILIAHRRLMGRSQGRRRQDFSDDHWQRQYARDAMRDRIRILNRKGPEVA